MKVHPDRSRRSFVQALTAGTILHSVAEAKPARSYTYSEIETKIDRKDFRGLTKEDLPTPCLILDQQVLERNLHRMSQQMKSSGFHLRAHCKVHKSVDIARRQMALGAIGICCATIAEAELMSSAGIQGTLWTCQPAGRHKVKRTVELSRRDPSFMCVVDDPAAADALNEAAALAKTKVGTVVDVNIGLERQGTTPGTSALELAQHVMQSKHLRFAGLMGYSGAASHAHGWEKRRAKSGEVLVPLLETLEMCRKSGLPVEIVTGGSTGTYDIDCDIKGMTELQAGSYALMDSIYCTIGSKNGQERYDDFGQALTVLTTIISRRTPRRVTTDYGGKAMNRPTDVVKDMPDVKVGGGGAEYGSLAWENPDHDFKLGDRVEIYLSNLDMSVNAYDRMYVCRNEQIVDVYPIMGRSGPPQR